MCECKFYMPETHVGPGRKVSDYKLGVGWVWGVVAGNLRDGDIR